MAGKPVIKGTRIFIYFILELLSIGWNIDNILKRVSVLFKRDVLVAINYAIEKNNVNKIH